MEMNEMIPERGHLIGMILAFVLAICGLVLLPVSSDAILAADVDMDLITEEQFARFTGDGFTQVQYEGIVSVRVVSLPNGQVMDITLHLENEELEYEFDPCCFLVSKSTAGDEFSFTLSIFVDETVQAGEINIGAYARYSYRPGVVGGESNVSEAMLYVDECKNGVLDGPLSIDVREGNMEIMALEVMNCGNTWMVYDLFIDGISRAGTRGIEIDSEDHFLMELYYQTSEIIEIPVYVEEIEKDTTMALEITLKDHDTGDEFCRMSIIINAYAEDEQEVPVSPNNDGNDDPDDTGGEDISPEPNDEDPGSEEPVDDARTDSAPSSSGPWIIIPLAILAMLLGVGFYVLMALKRDPRKG